MYTRKILICILLFGLISVTAAMLLNRNTCSKLSCLMMVGLSSYEQKEIYEDTQSIYRGLYQHDAELLRIEIRSHIDKSQAQRRIDGLLTQIKSTYEKARAPYPGELSDTIECGKDFMPMFDEIEAGSLSIFRVTSYLTDRLTYGACTSEQAVNRSLLAQFYCPSQKKLYQLEFIAPVGEFNERQPTYDAMLKSIRCT